jgi:hypothetical protein
VPRGDGGKRQQRLLERRIPDLCLELGARDPHHEAAGVGRFGGRDVQQRGLSDTLGADEQKGGTRGRHGR